MKSISTLRLACIVLALGLVGAANAGSTPAHPSTQAEAPKPDFCWSLFWGAYTRDGCPKSLKKEKVETTIAAEMIENLPQPDRENANDAAPSYEIKSSLFGAIKWTAKKKSQVENQNVAQ